MRHETTVGWCGSNLVGFNDSGSFASTAFVALGPTQKTADTTEATRAADDPVCLVEDGHTVWYALPLDTTTEIVVDTVGSDYNTTLSALTGTKGSLTQVACNDDSGSLQSRIWFTQTPASPITSWWAHSTTAPGGSLVLNGQPPPPQLAVTLDPTGTVTPAGAAIIHGNLSCSRPGDITVFGTLSQKIKKIVAVGSFRTTVAAPDPAVGRRPCSVRPASSGAALPPAWPSPSSSTRFVASSSRARTTGTVQPR